MYLLPADPVTFRRQQRQRRHRLKVTVLQVVNGTMLLSILLWAAAQGSWR